MLCMVCLVTLKEMLEMGRGSWKGECEMGNGGLWKCMRGNSLSWSKDGIDDYQGGKREEGLRVRGAEGRVMVDGLKGGWVSVGVGVKCQRSDK